MIFGLLIEKICIIAFVHLETGYGKKEKKRKIQKLLSKCCTRREKG
jgi:hypothetical protein